ncbi:Autophagocytosi associated protein, active-site domain-containing protein [Cladophialophora immunda]|nr:Autophagocytosi associated protein, active-site domain-containing protein [Cladophialophora immunda]
MKDSVQAFPAITEQEFSQACGALEQRSSDKISDTDWLRVRWTGEELLIRAKRKRTCKGEAPSDNIDAQSDERFETGIEDCVVGDSLLPKFDSLESLIVDFSITLSPIYSVPVLWFACRNGQDNKALSLEQVYEWLVPEPSLASLHEVGVMGGISMAHHPVSDRPAFFLHPCNTQGALSALKPMSLSPEEYLILWLGLIGSAVGLHVPSKLMST